LGALPYNPEKQSVPVCTRTAANAHLYMPAGPMFHSLAEPCVSIQLPSTARCKQETGVEVGVRSMINASVSQQEGEEGATIFF